MWIQMITCDVYIDLKIISLRSPTTVIAAILIRIMSLNVKTFEGSLILLTNH